MGKPIKTILGFSQGAIVAAIIAIGVSFAIKTGTLATWITMPLAGVLVGITCGQAIWKEGQPRPILLAEMARSRMPTLIREVC